MLAVVYVIQKSAQQSKSPLPDHARNSSCRRHQSLVCQRASVPVERDSAFCTRWYRMYLTYGLSLSLYEEPKVANPVKKLAEKGSFGVDVNQRVR